MPKLRGEGGEVMTGIEKLRNLSATLGEGQPFTLEEIYIGGKTASEWLADVADQIERETLPRTCFEDGKIARIGEVARYLSKNRTIADMYVDASGYHKVIFDDNVYLTLRPSEMLERPEPPDTWERIEADAYVLDVNFDEGTDEYARTSVIRDLVRRCKALAGVE